MQNRKVIQVTPKTLTPAQLDLLDFCSHLDAPDIRRSLKATLDLALFNEGGELTAQDTAHIYCARELARKLKAVTKEGNKPILQAVS